MPPLELALLSSNPWNATGVREEGLVSEVIERP